MMLRVLTTFAHEKVAYLRLRSKEGREKLYRLVMSERKLTAQLEAVTEAEAQVLRTKQNRK